MGAARDRAATNPRHNEIAGRNENVRSKQSIHQKSGGHDLIEARSRGEDDPPRGTTRLNPPETREQPTIPYWRRLFIGRGRDRDHMVLDHDDLVRRGGREEARVDFGIDYCQTIAVRATLVGLSKRGLVMIRSIVPRERSRLRSISAI